MRIAAFCFAVLFAAMLLIPSIFAMLGRETPSERSADETRVESTDVPEDRKGQASISGVNDAFDGEQTVAPETETSMDKADEELSVQAHQSADGPSDSSERRTVDDETLTVMLLSENGEEICTDMKLSAFLYGALLGEMPSSFEPEALRACAVAARSYVLYVKDQKYRRDGHKGADICGDYRHCMAYLSYEDACELWGEVQAGAALEKMKEAVDSTAGMVLTYGGQVCNAMFHSMSWKCTESASNLWTCDMPYLSSVDTPETTALKGMASEVRCSVESALQKLRSVGVNASSKDLKNAVPVYNSSGRVDKVRFASGEATGTQIQQLFSLRSTEFSLTYDADTQEIVFSVLGFGHGIGMSQYGAELMAQEGERWQSIVLHYYPGAILELFS